METVRDDLELAFRGITGINAFIYYDSAAILGSREFENLWMVRILVDELPAGIKILSGGANGVDSVAVDQAVFRNKRVKVIKPDYKKYDHSLAPLKRNHILAQESKIGIFFWDGKSTGTLHAIRCFIDEGKHILVWKEDTTLGTFTRHSSTSDIGFGEEARYWLAAVQPDR